MLDRTIQRETAVRFVPRLGRKRPLIERIYQYRPIVLWLLLPGAWIGGGALLQVGKVGELLSTVHVVGALLYIGIFALGCHLLGGRDDVRCIISAHERKHLMQSPDRRRIAVAIALRRSAWLAWLNESHKRVNLMQVFRSAAWRALLVAGLFLSTGVELWKQRRFDVAKSSSGPLHSVLVFSNTLLTVLVIVAGYRILARIHKRLVNSLSDRHCPDCEYSLEPGETVSPEPGVTVEFGPARCPECGTPWPRVPPIYSLKA